MSASHLLGLQGLQQTPAFIWHSYGTRRELIRQIDTYCSFYTNLFAVLNCFCLTFFLCHRFTNLSLDGGADSSGDQFFNIRANSLRTWAAFPIYHLLGNKLTFFYLSWLTRFSGNWTTLFSVKKHIHVHNRCLIVSTNQADPSYFYFRISWILMEHGWISE